MEKYIIVALGVTTIIGWSKWFFLNQKYRYFIFKKYKEEIDKCNSIDELKDYVRYFEYKKNNGFSSLSKRIYERGKVKAIEKK